MVKETKSNSLAEAFGVGSHFSSNGPDNINSIKTYILVFDATKPMNIPALNQYIIDSVDIVGYWNYIPNVYCLKSKLDSTGLVSKFGYFFQGNNFMIMELNIYNMNGPVPRGGWDWFYTNGQKFTQPFG